MFRPMDFCRYDSKPFLEPAVFLQAPVKRLYVEVVYVYEGPSLDEIALYILYKTLDRSLVLLISN